MPTEPVRHRKEKREYSVVLIPNGESSKTKNFTFGKFGAAAFIGTMFFVIVGLVIAVLMYTPVGRFLPIPNAELEERYGKQIVAIQRQLNGLLEEMITLRTYNVQLRKALGEQMDVNDSTVVERSVADQTSEAVSGSQNVLELTDGSANQQPNENTTPREFPGSSNSTVFSQNGVNKSNSRLYDFPLAMPADGFISREFDGERKHFGIDIAGKEGSAVIAAANGNVVFAGWTYDDGYLMIIAHPQGYVTEYKHNKILLKTTGSAIKRGDVIALLGNTGKTSSGPHLHFEVWKDGIVLDPGNYLLTTQ